MNKFKKFLEWLKKPSVKFAIIYSIFALAIIAFTLVWLILGNGDSVLAYIFYGLSAVALSYLVYIIIYFVPRMKNAIINTMKKYKFTNELYESYGFRSTIFLGCSFTINVAYAIFQGVMAILGHSIWYGALATYYIAISLIKGGIVAVSRRKNKPDYPLEKQVRAYRNCGIYLVLLNFALMGAIVQMVLTNGGFRYAGLMIYVMATYTFWKLGNSIYNLVKARKHNDCTVQSIKNINFAGALVSILALQTAMIDAFGGDYNPYLPNSLTGGAVSLIIIALGIVMIVRGQSNLNRIRKEKEEGKDDGEIRV